MSIDNPSGPRSLLLERNAFLQILALADAFGFKRRNLDSYLVWYDKDPPSEASRWWELMGERTELDAVEALVMDDALWTVEQWLLIKRKWVPDSADVGTAQRFYELRQFVGDPNARPLVLQLKNFIEGRPVWWRSVTRSGALYYEIRKNQ